MNYLKNVAKLEALFAVFVLVACGNVGFLLPFENGEPEIHVLSVSQGAILMPEDTFEVSIHYDVEQFFPDRMVIELHDAEGEVLFSVELDQDAIYELPLPVALPADLGEGVYRVSIAVFEKEEEIAFSESLFFFVIEDYEIESITAYPQIFYPGGKGLLIADLAIPDGSNPYLKWSTEGIEIYAGSLMSGADRLQLDVPKREGVYSIRLEVFPFEPAGVIAGLKLAESGKEEVSPSYDFFSVISLEAQFFVSKTQSVSEGEFGPEEDYYSLFHFRGEAVDWGYHRRGRIAVPVGAPILDITRGVFGFRFAGNDGFAVDEVLLPVEDGYVQPFSYSVRFLVEAYEGSVTTILDGRDEPVFSMGFSDGMLTASLLGTSSSVEPLLEKGYGAELTLTVIPEDDVIRYLWFVDGVLVGGDLFDDYEPVQIAPGGLTVIAGAGGMLGILDELGVFYRLTDDGAVVDLDVFLRAMERAYGADLVFAEGFDAEALPDELVFSGEGGTYTLDGGSLFLPAGTGIGFPLISTEFESLTVQVTFNPAVEKVVETAVGEAWSKMRLMLRSSSDNTLLYELAGDAATFNEEGILSIVVQVTDEGMVAMHGGEAYSIGAIDEGVDLFIENRGENGELAISNMLIFKNRIESDTESSQAAY